MRNDDQNIPENQSDADKRDLYERLGIGSDPGMPFKRYEMLHFTDNELIDLENEYKRIDHPLCQDILILLEGVRGFRDATTTEHYFKQMRDDSQTSADLLVILNNMADAILEAENKLNSLNDPSAKQTMADVLAYCRRSISARLYELKVLDDRLYSVYTGEANKLKDCLPD